ncbi:MAG: hypothetical protein LBG73_08660 [Spirochaetaceae bacterium]|nr:hypothetical protein [Spirochaetaceae bacterium]
MDNETEMKIIERLDKLVDGMDKIVGAIPKPASRIQRVIDALATFATVAGLLGIVQIIIEWIGG